MDKKINSLATKYTENATLTDKPNRPSQYKQTV